MKSDTRLCKRNWDEGKVQENPIKKRTNVLCKHDYVYLGSVIYLWYGADASD